MSSGKRRALVKVRGHVQGVGYRYFVQRAARVRKLTGWVVNVNDGSVRLEAQGPESSIQELLHELRFGPSLAEVENLTVDWVEPVPNETNFNIRFQ